jgi:hypothetical protein
MQPARTARIAIPLLLSASACGKSAPPPRSLVEDKARRDVPIAVCLKPLSPADVNESGAPRPEAYWSSLLPSFRAFDTTFDAIDCIGRPVAPEGKTAAGQTVHVSGSDATITPVADGTQLVWLRTFPLSDRVASGPLALVRPRPAELDVYAIGSYTGSAAHSHFDVAKIGPSRLLAIRDEGCADVKVETECESTLSFVLIAGGQLVNAAKTPSERLKFNNLKDVGRVKWRLTTELVFEPQDVRVKEKLSVHDAGDNEVRRIQGERVFNLQGDALVCNTESIWSQVDKR